MLGRLAVVALLLTVAPAFAPALPRTYDVAISPEFTPGETAAILDGMRSWTAAVPSLRLNVVPSCAPPKGRHGAICLYPADDDALLAWGLGESTLAFTANAGGDVPGPEGAKIIVLDVGRMHTEEPAFRFGPIVAHEFGHAMGLPHDSAPFTLMYPAVSHCTDEGACSPVQALAPTARDVAAWRAARY